MLNAIKKSWLTYFVVIAYVAIFVWWMIIRSNNTENNYLFNWSYGLIALTSAIYGMYVAKTRWGGKRSALGKLLIFLGIGLLAQWIGLQIWTYYNVIAKVEVPYPSWADVGYFGLVPAYVVAALLLAKVTGARYSLKSLKGKLIVFVIPVVSLIAAYLLFVNKVGFADSSALKVFFDLAYPLGEIIPVTIALAVLLMTTDLLGGKMRSRIQLLVFAFAFQFITEYFFLYQTGVGTYVNGGISDLLYATSYAIMGLTLASFSRIE